MHNYYDDIIEKLGEPIWWDEVGCPRYCEFSPNKMNSIYASESVLLLIACQNCKREFKVAMSHWSYDELCKKNPSLKLKKQIINKTIHYGDPPNIQCCDAGPSMNCDDIKVIEYWNRDRLEWERDSSLEIDVSYQEEEENNED